MQRKATGVSGPTRSISHGRLKKEVVKLETQRRGVREFAKSLGMVNNVGKLRHS